MIDRPLIHHGIIPLLLLEIAQTLAIGLPPALAQASNGSNVPQLPSAQAGNGANSSQSPSPPANNGSNTELPAPTSSQDIVESNPIKLYISKEAPSFDLQNVGGSFTVDEAIKIAQKNNLSLKQAELDTTSTRFLTRASLARFGPQVSFNTFYSSSTLNQMLFLPTDTSVVSAPMQPIVKGNSLSLLFAATQPIFTGGRLLGGYRAARAMERQTLSYFQTSKNDTALKVREAYLEAAWTEAKLRVDTDYEKSKEWSASNIKTRMDDGKAPRAEFLREQAEVARAKKQVNDDFRNYNVALVKLKTILGINYSSLFFLKDGLEYKDVIGNMSDYLIAAGTNRPEIAIANNKVAELRARKQVALAKYAPQINAYGLSSNINGSSPDGNANGEWGAAIGVVGGVTLFDSGLRVNELRAAESAVKIGEIKLAETKQKVAEDVSVAWIELDFAKKNVEEAKTEIASAEEDQRLLHARYLAGKAIALEDFDAAVQLLQARLGLLEAIYKYRLAEAKLLWASAR